MLERVHQVLGDCLRSFNFLEQNKLNPNDPFEEFLTAAAHAIQSAHHTTLGYSPAQLIFGKDMFTMPAVNFHVNWENIKANKQNKIQQNNDRETSRGNPTISIL